MSEQMQEAGMFLASGEFTQAMGLFDSIRQSEPDLSLIHI